LLYFQNRCHAPEDWRDTLQDQVKSFSAIYEKVTAAHVVPAPLRLHSVFKETNYFGDWL
jgi:hypothetical protein